MDEVVARSSIAISVFNTFGIDTCCGGNESLETAARHAHVDMAALLAALDAAICDAEGVVSEDVT